MSDRPAIEWEQVKMSGTPLPHWMARVIGASRSVVFASVNLTLYGTWKINFSPKGRGLRDPITYIEGYPNREKAMYHVERWAAHHGHRVPPEPPRGLAQP